jgi:hypothetical protein
MGNMVGLCDICGKSDNSGVGGESGMGRGRLFFPPDARILD